MVRFDCEEEPTSRPVATAEISMNHFPTRQAQLSRFVFSGMLFSLCMLPGWAEEVRQNEAVSNSGSSGGLIRSKRPDRGSYRPPVLSARPTAPDVETERETPRRRDRFAAKRTMGSAAGLQPDGKRDSGTLSQLPEPVVLDELSVAATAEPIELRAGSTEQAKAHARIALASHEQPVATTFRQSPDQVQPIVSHDTAQCSCESCQQGSVVSPAYVEPSLLPPAETVWEGTSLACDAAPCGTTGCDSIGCNECGRFGLLSKRWFGSIELLLMFRKGDLLPPLATTGDVADESAAGELGQDRTVIIAGQHNVFDDLNAGGRLTIGSWLDGFKDRSIVGRGWFSGEATYGFVANQDSHPVLTRPFFNVSDGQTAAQGTQVIAFPDRASGELRIAAESNVSGADVSMRQLWYKRYGATVDLLYGYQYMRMDESLAIASRSTSINDDFAPVGAVIAVRDAFDVQNDFHGGQFGVASHYREGPWSFSSLVKIGFGSVRREATLSGSTSTSIDGNNASNDNGLLVRSTNSGTHSSDTFGWVPELDFTLGWQQFPAFDVTVGYHFVAMTDALQVSGAIDPELAVNLSDSPVNSQNPAFQFEHDTFYVHGIHFGLSYIY
jgi:hypothetical protein